jgi:hypothetical protein
VSQFVRRRLSTGGLPPALKAAQCTQKSVEIGVSYLGLRVFAARRLVVARRRSLDAEELVKDVPDIAVGTVSWLAKAHIEDDDDRPLVFVGHERRLGRERQAVAAFQMQAADDGRERAAQSVRLQAGIAGVDPQLCANLAVSGLLACQLVDLDLYRRRNEDVESLCRGLRRAQSSGPNVSGTIAGTRSPRLVAARLSPESSSQSLL